MGYGVACGGWVWAEARVKGRGEGWSAPGRCPPARREKVMWRERWQQRRNNANMRGAIKNNIVDLVYK